MVIACFYPRFLPLSGRGIDYEGPRTEEKIVEFAHKMLGPAVKTQLDKPLSGLIKSKPDPPVFVHIGQRSELYAEFENMAEVYMPNVPFYHIEAPHEGKVAVVKDGKMIDFTRETRLASWIGAEKEASFAEFNLKTAKRFLKSKFIVVAIDKGQ